MKIVVTLTDAEAKALAWATPDPEAWIVYAAKERCRVAMEEIFQIESQRMLSDPAITSIPADREVVVLASELPSAAERQAADVGGLEP
jgi:hypothetical protein